MAPSPRGELAAFCATCPSAQEVTDFLAALGFKLIFSMEERREPAYMQLPPMPAQYHYREETYSTEVIYLEGSDAAEEGEYLPAHAARFWLHPGASMPAAQLIEERCAARWRLAWEEFTPEQKREAVA